MAHPRNTYVVDQSGFDAAIKRLADRRDVPLTPEDTAWMDRLPEVPDEADEAEDAVEVEVFK